MKNISYTDDDDDFGSDPDAEGEEEGYTSDDAAELERCTGEVFAQLSSGDGGVGTPSKEEVKEAVWYYYFDVHKAVGYLRGEFGLLSFFTWMELGIDGGWDWLMRC